MIARIKELFQKHKSVILYIIFGGLTTVIDWAVSFALYHFFADAMDTNRLLMHVFDVIAWICAITFAYVTNRVWVFDSKRRGFLPILAELGAFAGGRLLTLGMQEGILLLWYTILKSEQSPFLLRIVVSVLVVVANYFISKLLVFRKKK